MIFYVQFTIWGYSYIFYATCYVALSSIASIKKIDTPFLRYATRKSNSTFCMIMHFLFGTILVARSVQNKWSQSEANFVKNVIFFASVAFIHFNRKHSVISVYVKLFMVKLLICHRNYMIAKLIFFFVYCSTWIFFVFVSIDILHNDRKSC